MEFYLIPSRSDVFLFIDEHIVFVENYMSRAGFLLARRGELSF